MQTLTIRLRTRTPLWTGGLDGSMDRIHETGLLGSLRWWYEAIVRGLGGWACDPTEGDRCPDRQGRYCDVCTVFGATGLQRAFRLEGPVWWNKERSKKLVLKMRDHRGWHLGRGLLGEGTLQFVPLRLPKGWSRENLWKTLSLTLYLIECWSGLGAHTQQGYGVLEVDGLLPSDLDGWEPWPQQRSTLRSIQRLPDRPSLDGFFFAKVRFTIESHEPKKWLHKCVHNISPTDELNWYLQQSNASQQRSVLPLAPVVRYHLRHMVRSKWDGKYHLRHRLMGELGQKSLIHVSHAYPVKENKWEFRIWGWMPESLSKGVSRADVLTELKSWLGVSQHHQWHPTQNAQLWIDLHLTNPEICWYEIKSDESTETYLQELLKCDCKKSPS